MYITKINNITIDNAEILILLCQCIISYDIVTIFLRRQDVCGILIEMK